MVPSHIFITDLDLVRCSQAVVTRLLRFCVAWNVNSAVLCSLECEAKEEEVMGIDMLLVNEKGVLRFVGVIKSTFSDHEQSAQCIMVDLQGDRDSKDDLENLPTDPGDRKTITEYFPNQRDEVRRKYLMRGPCQPRGHEFPKTLFQVLEYVEIDGSDGIKRRQANGLLKYFHTFDFVFYLQLMLLLLGITNNLSKALQRKDQDILNAMSLVKSTKQQLYKIRDDGWESLINKVFTFCENYKIEFLVMDDEFDSKNSRKRSNITNLHHYKVECFYTVLDMQIQEFNDHFDEEFDQLKVMRLSEFYLEDFGHIERITLEHQLGLYIDNIREDERFSNLKDLGDLAYMMVKTKKHLSHPQLLKNLVSPINTSSRSATAAEVGDMMLTDIPGGTCVDCKCSNGQRLSGDEPSNEMDGIPSNQTRHPIR
uniref:Uncharacterized protein n=1 Tax=Brassica oleracea var. oleracea TaxID=109376 RepID=A0A0D3BRS1_BRAOL